MKFTLNQRLLILRDKVSKILAVILAPQKTAWVQTISIVSLVYVSMVSMAFVNIDEHKLLAEVEGFLPTADYEGVVTVVGDEATLKTSKVTYLLVDPEEVLHKSPYFAKNSQLQSFRVCVEAERSAAKIPRKGSYAYKLYIKDLCG